MNGEHLIVPVLLLLALLVQLWMVRKRSGQGEEREEGGLVTPPESIMRRLGEGDARGLIDKTPVPRSGKKAFDRPQRRRPRVITKVTDARRGIVLMTVLGPCRANDVTAYPH